MLKATLSLLLKLAIISTLLLIPLAIFQGSATPAYAQSDPEVDFAIDIGFDGHCKFGDWLPIQVRLSATEVNFSGELSIAYSQAEYLIPLALAPNSRKTISTQIFINERDVSQEITFLLIPAQKNASPIFLEKKSLTCFADRILGVLTNTPSAFTKLNALQPANSTDVVLLSYESLPENVLGLDSLDALIIANSDLSHLDADQFEAIKLWVMQGGHLIFGGGAQWQTTSYGFEELLPLSISGSQIANVRSGLSSFGTGLSLSNIILVEGALQSEGRILLQDGRHPLVVQRAYGSGTVSLLTFDPNVYEFWKSENAVLFYDYLLNSVPESYDFASIKDWNSAIAAVSLFQNQNLPSIWLISAVMAFYILLIGPVHFWILRRVNQPELAWFTTPVLTLILTALMLAAGWDLRGTKPQINLLEVVHQWPGCDQALSSGIVGIFTPRRGAYQFQVEEGFSPYPFAPYNYYDTPNNRWQFNETTTFIAETEIKASEIMPLGVMGQVPPIPIRSELTLVLESSTAVLSGEIQNDSGIDLKNALLIYPGGFEFIGIIPSGTSIQIDLPIDLLSQKSSNTNSVLYSNVYNPNTYYGSLLLGKIAPATQATRNATQQQIDLIEAVLGNYTVPPVGFLLVGWDDSGASNRVRLIGEEFDATPLTAYMISLPVGTETSKNQMIVPPALFNWFITESSSLRYANPYDLRFGFEDDVEIYYRLAQPVAYSKVVELIIHLEGNDARPDFPLDFYLWNYRDGEWDEFNVRSWKPVLISDPSDYVEKNITEVRLKLAENGNGGGAANVDRVDISLVVEP